MPIIGQIMVVYCVLSQLNILPLCVIDLAMFLMNWALEKVDHHSSAKSPYNK